ADLVVLSLQYVSRHLLHLHSFPTRRSSDLKWSNAPHEYVFSDAERDEHVEAGLAKNWRLPKDGGIQRYKGLGEMDYKELWDTTMNPETRTLKQVTLDDAAAADEIFSILMGEDVESRRAFIQRNARDVRFLDI